MRTVTLAAAIAALTVTAAPAFAMDNPVNYSRDKVEMILDHQDGKAMTHETKSVVASTTAREGRALDRYSLAKERLFGFRSEPSGR